MFDFDKWWAWYALAPPCHAWLVAGVDPISAGLAIMARFFLKGYRNTPSDREFVMALPWLIAVQQIRIIRFLQDYCVLDSELWNQKIEETLSVMEQAAANRFSICGLS